MINLGDFIFLWLPGLPKDRCPHGTIKMCQEIGKTQNYFHKDMFH